MKKDDIQMNTAFPSCPDEKQYKRKITKLERVLEYLIEKGDISPADALTHCNCWRLSAVVHTLKKAGISIETQAEPHNGGQHARYFLFSPVAAKNHLEKLKSRARNKAA